MKSKNIFFYLKVAVISLAMTVPMLALAQTGGPIDQGLNAVRTYGGFQNQSGTVLGARNVVELIGTIIKIMLFVAGALAVLFVIIGGVLYLTSAGSEEQAAKGKKTITNALIGIIIIVLSYVIVNVVVNWVTCNNVVNGC